MKDLKRVVTAPLRRYRWRRLLRSCRLDPGQLPLPLEEPGASDFIICGCPRSGTSLLAAVLFRPPESVVSMEPWDGLRLPPAELFRSLRSEISTTGRLTRGRLDAPAATTGGRVLWRRDGEMAIDVTTAPGFLLGVKWPAFWRYLDLLPSTKFLVCVRDPVEVVSSFGKVGGRLAAGLDYDVAFNARMNADLEAATDDPRTRRALLYEYVNSAVARHSTDPNVLIVRYERWFDDPESLVADMAAFLGVKPFQPAVSIRPPSPPDEPDLADLVERWCPSARALGYGSGARR